MIIPFGFFKKGDGGGWDGTFNDVDGASYDSVLLNTTPEEAVLLGATPSLDGTKIYVTGNTGDAIRQYSGTAWDLSTFSYDSKSHVFTTQDTQPFSCRWKSDGTKLYMAGNQTDTIYQYSASGAFDISTLTYDTVSVGAQSTVPRDLHFQDDGSTMFVLDNTNDIIKVFDLGTDWDLSTAVYNAGKDFSVTTPATNPMAIYFNPNGLQFYVSDNAGGVSQWTCTSAWDLSTCTYDSIFIDPAQDTAWRGVWFNTLDGSKMYLTGQTTEDIFQYSI